MEELRKSPLNPEGQNCSHEGCERTAVWGITTIRGQDAYDCEKHCEIGLLYGQLDWLTGDRDHVVGDWLEQIRQMPESAWSESGGLKDYLFLRDHVSDKSDMPYKWQHECTLQSLEAAIDLACKLTQEKIALLEQRLEIDEEYPGEPYDLADHR